MEAVLAAIQADLAGLAHSQRVLLDQNASLISSMASLQARVAALEATAAVAVTTTHIHGSVLDTSGQYYEYGDEEAAQRGEGQRVVNPFLSTSREHFPDFEHAFDVQARNEGEVSRLDDSIGFVAAVRPADISQHPEWFEAADDTQTNGHIRSEEECQRYFDVHARTNLMTPPRPNAIVPATPPRGRGRAGPVRHGIRTPVQAESDDDGPLVPDDTTTVCVADLYERAMQPPTPDAHDFLEAHATPHTGGRPPKTPKQTPMFTPDSKQKRSAMVMNTPGLSPIGAGGIDTPDRMTGSAPRARGHAMNGFSPSPFRVMDAPDDNPFAINASPVPAHSAVRQPVRVTSPVGEQFDPQEPLRRSLFHSPVDGPVAQSQHQSGGKEDDRTVSDVAEQPQPIAVNVSQVSTVSDLSPEIEDVVDAFNLSHSPRLPSPRPQPQAPPTSDQLAGEAVAAETSLHRSEGSVSHTVDETNATLATLESLSALMSPETPLHSAVKHVHFEASVEKPRMADLSDVAEPAVEQSPLSESSVLRHSHLQSGTPSTAKSTTFSNGTLSTLTSSGGLTSSAGTMYSSRGAGPSAAPHPSPIMADAEASPLRSTQSTRTSMAAALAEAKLLGIKDADAQWDYVHTVIHQAPRPQATDAMSSPSAPSVTPRLVRRKDRSSFPPDVPPDWYMRPLTSEFSPSSSMSRAATATSGGSPGSWTRSRLFMGPLSSAPTPSKNLKYVYVSSLARAARSAPFVGYTSSSADVGV